MVIVFLLFWLLVGLAVFFVAMRRGPRRPGEEPRGGGTFAETRWGRRLFALAITLVFAATLAVPALVLVLNSAHRASAAVGGVHLTPAQQRGRDLFARSCAVCHTLSAVKSVGRIGPNLDVRVGSQIATVEGRKALVLNAVAEGRARGLGQMPALLYQGREAEEVADFVAAVAGH
jgi:mono/diheme cytochrome c family protein